MSYTSITNNELYKAVQAYSKNFANMTAQYSYDEFEAAAKGGQTSEEICKIKNEFLQTAMMFWLNEVIAPDAKDIFEDQGFGAKYFSDFAGAMQNMYVKVGKPINPRFVNVTNGAGADPFMVYKPVVAEIFYTFNFDYQNVVTIGDVQLKTAFANANGLSMLVGAVMKALASEFINQKVALKEEALNAAINDTTKPLLANQTINVTISEEPTRDELITVIGTINNLVDEMTLKQTSAFNRMRWADYQDRDRLVMLTRPSFKNALKTKLLESAFNKEDLNIDIKNVVVQNFGGLIATKDGTDASKLTLQYDADGRQVGYTDTDGTAVAEEDVVWLDPNADVVAIICDKETIFELDQNPYSVYGIYNPANMLTTYWANKPTGSIHYDPYRNFVVIKNVPAAAE